jgi:hypothetical protein
MMCSVSGQQWCGHGNYPHLPSAPERGEGHGTETERDRLCWLCVVYWILFLVSYFHLLGWCHVSLVQFPHNRSPRARFGGNHCVLGLGGIGYIASHGACSNLYSTAAQGYFGIVVLAMILWVSVYYLPLYYEIVKSYSVIVRAVSLFPQTLTVCPAAVITGVLITKTGRYRVIMWVGWLIGILGMGLQIYLHAGSSIPQWIFLTLPAGIGCGILMSSTQMAVQASASDEDMASAAAMVANLRVFGQALGLAIFGAVFQNTVTNELFNSVLADQAIPLSNNAISLVSVIDAATTSVEEKAVLVRAAWLGLRGIWIAQVPFFFAAGVVSLLSKELNLDRVLNTEHVVREDGV